MKLELIQLPEHSSNGKYFVIYFKSLLHSYATNPGTNLNGSGQYNEKLTLSPFEEL